MERKGNRVAIQFPREAVKYSDLLKLSWRRSDGKAFLSLRNCNISPLLYFRYPPPSSCCISFFAFLALHGKEEGNTSGPLTLCMWNTILAKTDLLYCNQRQSRSNLCLEHFQQCCRVAHYTWGLRSLLIYLVLKFWFMYRAKGGPQHNAAWHLPCTICTIGGPSLVQPCFAVLLQCPLSDSLHEAHLLALR